MKIFAVLISLSAIFAEGASISIGTDLPTSVVGTATVAGLGSSYDNGNCCTLAQAFTLNAPFQVNMITLDLGASDTDSYTVWLTNDVGSSATAGNVLFESTQDFVNNGVLNGTATSFSTNLELQPGSYYLVLSSTSLNLLSQGWVLADSILPSTVDSLGENGSTGQGGAGLKNPAFAPSSTFVFFDGIASTPPSPGYAFELDGTVLPEPMPAVSLLIGLVGLALRGRRMRRAHRNTVA